MLKACIPCSDSELESALHLYHVFELDGFLRLLDPFYLFTMVKWIIAMIATTGMRVSHKVNYKELWQILTENKDNDCPSNILEHILSIFGIMAGEYFQFNQKKLSRFIGEQLLKQKSKWISGEFMDIWREELPEGFSNDISSLKVSPMYR